MMNLLRNMYEINRGRYHHLITLVIIALLSLHMISCVNAEKPEFSSENIKTKLSSDLLQILNISYCPPGKTPEDLIKGMQVLGQVRFNDTGEPQVHITVIVNSGKNSDIITPFITDPVTDNSYSIITGWISLENLTSIAELDEVKNIRPIFPPAHAGSFLTPVTESDNSSLPTDDSWKKKLSTDLLQIIDDSYLSPGQSHSDVTSLMEKTGEMRVKNDDDEVLINARISGDYSPSLFEGFFDKPAMDRIYRRIGGWISTSNISSLAMQEGIISLAVQIPPRTLNIQTEGDSLLGTKIFRNQTGLTGKEITIGVISDGVDGLSDLIKRGELPEVTVLSNNIGGDEGSAMLQIVHDIAPDAKLVFHDRGTSQIEYIKGFDSLIRNGCQIICDDITYIEPFFEDGYISQNVLDRILSYNVLYITAAGNFAKEHYQGHFRGYESQGYQWHMFNGSENSPDLKFTVPSGTAGHVILQWDDRFGASANNYDLFLYDENGREIARSVNLQDGDDDPMEWVRFMNSDPNPKSYNVKVVKAAADDALLEIYVLPLSGRSILLDPSTPEDSLFGQQVVKEAITVGAVTPYGKNLTVQDYSSKGPAFLRYPSPEIRLKPDVVAPDHITVLTGQLQKAIFTGTSASVPHIAGLAALIWSKDPMQSQESIKSQILNATGYLNSNSSWNPGTGYGMPVISNLNLDLLNYNKPDYPHSNLSFFRFEPRDSENAGNITLYEGWNMISIPYPLNEGIVSGEIFKSINTSGHSIWRYNASEYKWSPIRKNDKIEQLDVVWIWSTSTQYLNLNFDDSGINARALKLNYGWNPIGVPGRESITARDLMAPLNDTWTYILVFDPKAQDYRPSIINGGTGLFSPDRLLYPGEGLWLYMTGSGILFPV